MRCKILKVHHAQVFFYIIWNASRLSIFLYYLKYWSEPLFKKYSSTSRNLVDISAVLLYVFSQATITRLRQMNIKILKNWKWCWISLMWSGWLVDWKGSKIEYFRVKKSCIFIEGEHRASRCTLGIVESARVAFLKEDCYPYATRE